MNEINWNGGNYREGGTVINNGEISRIKKISIFVDQKTPSIFDRKQVLRVETEDGKILEID